MNEALVRSIKETPVKYARALGFDLLTDVHNDWLRTMLLCPDDYTLLGHRGSYKTTCLSVALAFGAVLRPDKSTFFIRKTDDDVTEIVAQAQKILDSDLLRYIAYEIYGIDLELTTRSAYKIDTNLARSNRGQVQIQGMGLNGSITGKHADYIYTDDIVNVKDRISRAEREQTKRQYMELQNIRNRGGRIMNTGTPWHKDDCISTLMPNVHRFSVYDTGLISDDQQQQLRASMSPSLYEYVYAAEGEAELSSRNLCARNTFMVTDASIDERELFGVYYRTIKNSKTDKTEYAATVCTANYIYDVRITSDGTPISNAGDPRPHYMGEVPIIAYSNNHDGMGDYEQLIPLIDAYNTLMSDRVNDVQDYVDAILIVYGTLLADEPEATEEGSEGGTPAAKKSLRDGKLLEFPDKQSMGAEWLTRQLDENGVEPFPEKRTRKYRKKQNESLIFCGMLVHAA